MTFKKRSLFAATALAVFAASTLSVFAAQNKASLPRDPVTTQQAALIKEVTHSAVTPDFQFKGPDANLVGVIGHLVNKHPVIVWIEGGKYVISGDVFGADGQSITREAAEKYGLAPKTLAPNVVAQDAMHLTGFTLGTKGPLVLAFEDPNCSFCNKFSEDTRQMIAEGKLRVRVVPVGFIKPDSANRAQAILQATNPAQAWMSNEAHFQVAQEEGGYPIPKGQKPDIKITKELAANQDLLSHTGQAGTPTIVFCANTGHGESPVVSHGAPKVVLDQLAKAGSLNSQGTCVNP